MTYFYDPCLPCCNQIVTVEDCTNNVCIDDILSASYETTISGISNGSCGLCTQGNGTWTVDYYTTSANYCLFRSDAVQYAWSSSCDPFSACDDITGPLNTYLNMVAYLGIKRGSAGASFFGLWWIPNPPENPAAGCNIVSWQDTPSPRIDCLSSFVLPFHSYPMGTCSGTPSSVTMTPV